MELEKYKGLIYVKDCKQELVSFSQKKIEKRTILALIMRR